MLASGNVGGGGGARSRKTTKKGGPLAMYPSTKYLMLAAKKCTN
jgi:hypothetical protein